MAARILAAVEPITPAPVVPAPAPTSESPAEPASAASPPAVVEVGTEGDSGAGAGEPPPAEELAKGERARRAAERAMVDARRHRERAAREAAQMSELARLRAERMQLEAQARELEELKKLSPRDKAKRFGLTAREIAEDALKEGTPEGAIEQLRAQLESERQERLTLQRSLQERELATAVKGAEESFLKSAADGARYPNVSKLPPQLLMAAARSLVHQLPRESLSGISDDALLSFLEEQFTSPQANGTQSTASVNSPTASAPNGKAGSALPRTLTNKLSSTRTPPAVPPNWEKMSDREQKAWMAEQLKGLATR